MKNKHWFFSLSFSICLSFPAVAQEFTVVPLTSTAGLGISNFQSYLYTYDFVAPLPSGLLCKGGDQLLNPLNEVNDPSNQVPEGAFCANPLSYDWDDDGRYFQSFFGPRMLANKGAIDAIYDFHRGDDMVDRNGLKSTDPMPDLFCMCKGKVVDITSGGSEGLSVIVKCDATFSGNAGWGKIHLAYRHLSSHEFPASPTFPIAINQGGPIGKMGGSGAGTNNPHLHFSVLRVAGDDTINVHPMRVFNPHLNKHLLRAIDAPPLSTSIEGKKQERVNMFLLHHQGLGPSQGYKGTATVRIAVPYNKASLRAIVIKKNTFTAVVDFEEISRLRDGDSTWLDNPVVGDLELCVFPFNRFQSAYYRFDKIRTALQSETHTGKNYPIPNEGIFKTPAYVIDIKINNLPMIGNIISNLEVYVVDIWGKGVKGTL